MPKQYLLEYELDWVKNNKKTNRTYTSQQKQNRTILEKLIAEPSEAPSSGTIGASTKKCNRFDAVEQKIGYNLQEMKTIARTNINRLQDVMHQMDLAGDSRSHGIGSGGGHIARLMKDPGPTNGHYIMAIEDPFNRKPTAELLPKLLLQNGKELNLPEWNHRFLEGGNVLAKYDFVTDSTPERLTRISTFRQEILKYRMNGSEVSKSDPNFSKTKTIKNKKSSSRGGTRGGVPAAKSTDSMDDDLSEEESLQSSVEIRQPVTLVMLAEELWKTLMRELKESAHSIEYSDLIEINALREPPEMVVNCIGYICVLLGLDPTWQSARCALFKEFRPFQNFLREVDPLGLPLKRVKKAHQLKTDKLTNVTIHALAGVCRPLVKIMRWVIAFNNIAQLIVTVEARKEAEREANGTTAIAAAAGGGKSDVSTSSQQTGAKKAVPAPHATSTAAAAAASHKAGTAHDNDDVSVGSLSSVGLPPELKGLAGDVLPIAENLAHFFQDLSQEQATLQTYYSRKDLTLYQEWVRQCKQREMLEVERLVEEEEYQDEGFDNENEAEEKDVEEKKEKEEEAGAKSAAAGAVSGSGKNEKVKKAGSVGTGPGSSGSSNKKHLSKGSERHRSTGSSFNSKLPAATAAAVSKAASDDNEDWLLEAVSKPATTTTAEEKKRDEPPSSSGDTKDNADVDATAGPKTPQASNIADAKGSPLKKKKASASSSGSAEVKKVSSSSAVVGAKHPRMVSASLEALISSVEANGGVPPSRIAHSQSTANHHTERSHTAGKKKSSSGSSSSGNNTRGQSRGGGARATTAAEKEGPRVTSAPSSESILEPTALVVEVPKDSRPVVKSSSGNNSVTDALEVEGAKKEEQEVVEVVVSPIAQLIRETASNRSPPGGKRSTITITKGTPTAAAAEGPGGAAGPPPPGSAKARLQIGSSSPEVLKKAHPSTLKSRDQISPLIVLTNPPRPEPTPSAQPEHIPAIAKLKPKARGNMEKAKGTHIKQLTAMHTATPKSAAKAAAAPAVDTSLESLLAEMEELEPKGKTNAKAATAAAPKKGVTTEVSQSKSPDKKATTVTVTPSVAAPPSVGTAAVAESASTSTSPSRKQASSSSSSPKRPGSKSGKGSEEDPYGEDEYEEYGNDDYEQEEQEEVVEVFKPSSAATAPSVSTISESKAHNGGEKKTSDDDKKAETSVVAPNSSAEAKASSSSSIIDASSLPDSKYSYKDTPSEKDEVKISDSSEYKADEKNSSGSAVAVKTSTAAPTAAAEAKSVKALHLSLDEFVLPSSVDLAGQSTSGTPAVGRGGAAAAVPEGVSARLSLSAQSSDSLDATTAWHHADHLKGATGATASSTTKPTPSSVYSAAVSTRSSLENELDSMFVFDTPTPSGAAPLLSPDAASSSGSASVAASNVSASNTSPSAAAAVSEKRGGGSPKRGSSTVVEEEDGGYGDDEFDVFE